MDFVVSIAPSYQVGAAQKDRESSTSPLHSHTPAAELPPDREVEVAVARDTLKVDEVRIDKLAQPKNSVPVPARLAQKKKTIAFGRTVNYSQCIEGTSVKKGSSKPHKSSGEKTMNKENANEIPNPASEQVGCKKTEATPLQGRTIEQRNKETSDVTEKIMGLFEQLNARLSNIEKTQGQNSYSIPCASNAKRDDYNFERSANNAVNLDIDSYTRQPHPIVTHPHDDEDRIFLDLLKTKLKGNPGLVNDVLSICKKYKNRNQQKECDPGPSRRQPERSVLRETWTMEHSFQPVSPEGDPLSTDSARYLQREGIGNFACSGPARSMYRQGYSVTVEKHVGSPSRGRSDKSLTTIEDITDDDNYSIDFDDGIESRFTPGAGIESGQNRHPPPNVDSSSKPRSRQDRLARLHKRQERH